MNRFFEILGNNRYQNLLDWTEISQDCFFFHQMPWEKLFK